MLTKTNLLKTLSLKTGFNSKFYPNQEDLYINQDFFDGLQKIIKVHKVKGLIVGYPIQDNKPSQNAYFVESLVKYLYKNKIIDLPCTFINEAFSTFEAGHFLEMLQVDQQNYNTKFSSNKKVGKNIFIF